MITLRAGSATSVGQVRSANQDSVLMAPEVDLYGVADGIGGNQGGEVASEMAVSIIAERTDGTVEGLISAVTEANRLIFGRSGSSPNLHGMGTTFVGLQRVDARGDDRDTVDAGVSPFTGADPEEPADSGDRDVDDAIVDAPGLTAAGGDDELCWINIGDSRIYLLRDGEIIQLSRDHSLVEELLRDGAISAEEARVHPQRNIITRSLGVDIDVRADIGTLLPFTGDRFLLCSDGLSNEVGDDQMAAVLRRLADPDEAAAELVRLANEHGGRDNITVVIVDVVDDGGRALAASEALADEPTRAVSFPMRTVGPRRGDPYGDADLDALPGQRSSLPPVDDYFTAADEDEPEESPDVRTRRLTWRVVAFGIALVAIAVATVAGIGWTARNSWFVAYDDGGNVALYRGRPGGTLFFDPELVQTSDLTRSEVGALYQDDLEAGKQFGSESAAERYLQSLIHAATDPGDEADDGGDDEDPVTTTTSGEGTDTTSGDDADTTTTTSGR